MEEALSIRDRFEAQEHTRGRGLVGENAACRYLVGLGYRVLERNVTNHAGEIDIIAQAGDTLCFIEVKARSQTHFGRAAAHVTPRKQRRLARAAALYLAQRGLVEVEVRFDVLGLERAGESWSFDHIQAAFEAEESFQV